MTGKFLKTLELLQLEYKSVHSPTAETEDNTTTTDTLTVIHLTTRRINSKPTLKMLRSHGFQSGLNPLMLVHWPGRSLWPEVRPQLWQQHPLQRQLQELSSSLELMDRLHQQMVEEEEEKKKSVQRSEAMQPVSFQLEKHGENFGLILNTEGFSPEELSVRQVGRKLRVSGKTEKKQEDGNGSYSYRFQEFRREFDLPEGVNPQAVTCCLSPDGKLHIQAPRAPCAEEAERELSIQRSTEEKTQQSESSHTGDDKNNSSSETQDNAGHMD